MPKDLDSATSKKREQQARLHRRATEVFADAVRQDPDDRLAFLDEACGGDKPLREEVEALLAHDSDREIARITGPRRALDLLASLLRPGSTRPH